MPPLIRNITFKSISAISENGALISSLPTNASTPGVEGVSLVNVSITIKRTGNVTTPKGKDYAPVPKGWPMRVAAFVDGMTFEGVPGARVVGGGVKFLGR